MNTVITNKSLPKNESLVYKELTKAKEPLTAYALLKKLGKHNITAPLQVYRALRKLITLGLVHKIEAINAFVTCNQPHNANHAPAFVICEGCLHVVEHENLGLSAIIHKLASDEELSESRIVVEIMGTCAKCLDKNGAKTE